MVAVQGRVPARCARRCAVWFAALLPIGGAAALADPPAPADRIPRVEIVAFGTYTPSEQYGRMPAQYRQDAIVEVTQTGMPRLIARTDRIEARPCTRFGVQYRALDLAPGDAAVAEVRVEHPPLTRPDGQRSSMDTYEVPLGSGIGWTGFDFDEAWEMVPGIWRFSFVYGGRVLAEQRFTIAVAPGAAVPRSCAPTVA